MVQSRYAPLFPVLLASCTRRLALEDKGQRTMSLWTMPLKAIVQCKGGVVRAGSEE
jgi:hypothetical protein